MELACSFCGDIFDEAGSISSTPCGHIYHWNCIMSWLSRFETCPHCRNRVTHGAVRRMNFHGISTTAHRPAGFENEVSNLKAELNAKIMELKQYQAETESMKASLEVSKNKASMLQDVLDMSNDEMADLESRMKMAQLSDTFFNSKLWHNANKIINGTKEDVDKILQECGNESDGRMQMAFYSAVLKMQLDKEVKSTAEALELSSKLMQENCELAEKIKFYEDNMVNSPRK